MLAADQLLTSGGRLAAMSATTYLPLDALLPATWSHGNPIDIVGDTGTDRYRATMEVLLDAAEVDAIAVMYCPTELGDPAANADAVRAELRRHLAHKPVLASWLGPVAGTAARKSFAELGIPTSIRRNLWCAASCSW